jgi:spermidine synthase
MLMKRIYAGAIGVKGFAGIVAQTLLFRELLVLFGGNELTLALMLAVWLISGAVGSRFFARTFDNNPRSLKPYGTLLLLSGLTLPLAIIILRASRTMLGVDGGEIFTLGQMVLVCIGGLLLPALCDGALFALGIRLFPSVSKIYFFEACGIIAGGIAFTLFLFSFLNAFQIALIVTILNLAARALLLPRKNARHWHHQTAWILTAAVIVIWPLAPKVNAWSLGLEWPKKYITVDTSSFYGRITLSREKNQDTLFYDGLPLLSLPDPEAFATEDFIHLPMLTKPQAKNILFIGNAAGGLLQELLKYPVQHVTVVAHEKDIFGLGPGQHG